MSNAPQPLTNNQIERLLQQRGEITARPRQTPREVFAKWLDNLGVGLGAGIAVTVALWFLRAPDAVLLSAPVALGLLVFAVMMAWRGSLDELSDWRNERAVRREVMGLRAGYEAEAAKLRRQLDMAFDEIETLERGLTQTARERDMALLDLGREREIAAQNTRRNYVRAEDPQPQDVGDAREMVRFYFDTGNHLSRRQAMDTKRWSADRWKVAQSLLVRAGVLAVNATQPNMLMQTLDEALGKLNTYLVHTRSQQPPVTAERNHYAGLE